MKSLFFILPYILFRYQFFTNVLLYTFFNMFLLKILQGSVVSHAIFVDNSVRQNLLRIYKFILYFLLTCLERAHSCLNTHASRTVISTPSISSNTFSYYLFYPYNSVSHSLWSPIVLDIYLSKNADINPASYFTNVCKFWKHFIAFIFKLNLKVSKRSY